MRTQRIVVKVEDNERVTVKFNPPIPTEGKDTEWQQALDALETAVRLVNDLGLNNEQDDVLTASWHISARSKAKARYTK